MTEQLSKAQALKWLELPSEVAHVDSTRFIVEGDDLAQTLAKNGITSINTVVESGLGNPRTQAGNKKVVAISFDLAELENIAGAKYADVQSSPRRPAAVIGS